MSEELRGQTVGAITQLTDAPAAGDGAGSVNAEGVAATPDAQTTASATKVNLDDFEEFKKFKSQSDRRYAEAERRAQEAAKRADALAVQVAEAQRRADEAQLSNADPDQRAAYWQNKARRQQEEMEQQLQGVARAAAYQQRATTFLDSVGLSPDTPGLDWGSGPSQDGYEKLTESASKLLAQRATTLEQTRQAELAKAARQAELSALKQTGVTQVGMSTGGASTDLRSAFLAEKAKIDNTGDQRGWVQLQKKYRELGLDV